MLLVIEVLVFRDLTPRHQKTGSRLLWSCLEGEREGISPLVQEFLYVGTQGRASGLSQPTEGHQALPYQMNALAACHLEGLIWEGNCVRGVAL